MNFITDGASPAFKFIDQHMSKYENSDDEVIFELSKSPNYEKINIEFNEFLNDENNTDFNYFKNKMLECEDTFCYIMFYKNADKIIEKALKTKNIDFVEFLLCNNNNDDYGKNSNKLFKSALIHACKNNLRSFAFHISLYYYAVNFKKNLSDSEIIDFNCMSERYEQKINVNYTTLKDYNKMSFDEQNKINCEIKKRQCRIIQSLKELEKLSKIQSFDPKNYMKEYLNAVWRRKFPVEIHFN